MDSGRAIRMALAMKRLKQIDLATMLNVRPATVNKMCVSISATTATMYAIAKALDMKLSDLIKLGED